jgi:anthranilate phosphoribosyltransferase
MDEISPAGSTSVYEVVGGRVTQWTLEPADYNLEWRSLDELAGGLPAANADRIRRLMDGREDESARRSVLLNAGAGIYVSGLARSYRDAVKLADQALASGRAAQVLHRLRERV